MEEFEIGDKVERSSAWHFDNQDGGAGNIGVVTEGTETDWCKVKWPNGESFTYPSRVLRLTSANLEGGDKMFEGYKVPECTEEEVRKAVKSRGCYFTTRECPIDTQCSNCVISYRQVESGVTQRYLDHRWPEKVAIHCPTQELWDRVRKKMGTSDWEYYARMPCISTKHTSTRGPVEYYEEKVYKIISAEEYLGEEKSEARWHKMNADGTVVTISLNMEEDMNASIQKAYKTTDEAVLVDKWFGKEIGGVFTHYLILNDHKKEYLEEAKRLEKEEAKDKE